jgi:hypothetical protein
VRGEGGAPRCLVPRISVAVPTPDQRLLVGVEAEGWNCAAVKVIRRVSTGRTEAGSLSLDQRYECLQPTTIESRVTS